MSLIKGQICSCDGSTSLYRTGIVGHYNTQNKPLLSLPEIPRCKRNFVFNEALSASSALLVFGRLNSGKLWFRRGHLSACSSQNKQLLNADGSQVKDSPFSEYVFSPKYAFHCLCHRDSISVNCSLSECVTCRLISFKAIEAGCFG